MSLFSYRARDMNGLLVMGQIDGLSLDSVRDTLADRGLIPISVSQGAANISHGFLTSLSNFFNQVSQQEILHFTRQFQTLFKAGMDMETLLSTMANQTRNKKFSETILKIKTDINSGSSLSRAFAQHPDVFDELYTNMLATGEEAGILDNALEQLCAVMEKEIVLKASIKSATLYPKIVVFVLVGAVFVMMTYVIPKFSSFYATFKAELPLPTQIMITTSYLIRTYWYIVLGSIVALIYALKRWRKTIRGRMVLDNIQWKIPVFGPLAQKVSNARFALLIASLYRAGLPITQGIEITAKTIGNEVFTQDIMMVKNEIEKGHSISSVMRGKKTFSPLLVEATAIGEKTGALDEMYKAIGEHFEKEVQYTLKNLTTLIEPIMLFLVFGMVTVFALAIFLPMWNMSKIVGHH
ncbi:MAG: hypothetical protein A3G32_07090 [Deltaproteobacteria bacterium RIFCSPLOWO2_12_FULL_40_28]|nr:MAG: hypothetical protein A3C45_07135 [Deltaproteobacteria bacterium RIFCSPHIGHO2_02_FULL_40_28]OGQ19278.1 MAG: hypothetical protein A3E27_04680 [Deltaproteobacteria bacterium RIFCSPHIGHO2_12_FULL_40_32]OGQ53734.1 MAG: hypothetical protein A3G32_07090 [Deltaproteobacteria bacterium RIFCSPLOWO2_12_FULL_40_28]